MVLARLVPSCGLLLLSNACGHPASGPDAPCVPVTSFPDRDGDGVGAGPGSRAWCQPPSGWTPLSGDCDDRDPTVHAGAPEACNARDDDCDDEVDEGVTTSTWPDVDGDGFGADGPSTEACGVPAGTASRAGDCDDARADVFPGAAEACDGADQDCDGSVDEGVTFAFHPDADGDGFGDGSLQVDACTAPSGTVTDGGDCDDTRADVHPGAIEICGDGVANDCDTPEEEAGAG